ncbi:MAG: hypothetical protein ABIR27_06445, partial [Dokdonella sp.]
MLEVKGRAIVFWYWSGVGVAISLLGWLSWDWLWDQGNLLRLVPVSLMISGVIFVGLGIWKALDKRPVIVANEQGFLDRTSFPHRRFAWGEIVKFRLITVKDREPVWLAIDLVDPAKLINKGLHGSRAILEQFEKQ